MGKSDAWRKELNDYEKKFLLPALKERMDGLLQYFDQIKAIAEKHRQSDTFGAVLRKLMTPPTGGAIPKFITPDKTNAELADAYFSQTIKMCDENYVCKVAESLERLKSVTSLEGFGTAMNSVHLICSSVLQAKDQLFLYDASSFYSLHDQATGNIVDVVPREFTVVLMPFKNTLRNMVLLCEGTCGTLDSWHKEQIEWRTRQLDLENARLNRNNQFLTVIVAIAISAAFLFLADPLDKIQKERAIERLTEKVERLEKMSPSERSNDAEQKRSETRKKRP